MPTPKSVIDDIVDRGQAQRDKASAAIEEALEAGKGATEQLTAIVRREVERQLRALGIRPTKKSTAKKTAAKKKSAAKKSTAKKTAAKKSTAKKTAAKKSTAKKAAAKKSAAKKSTAKKTAAT